MDKTLAYWIEKLIGFFLGAVSCFVAYKCWNSESAINSSKYYDVIIKASSSLFGFLLTILALTINGTNTNILRMKEKGSFLRLVRYHKVAVLLAFFLVIYSIVMYSIIETTNGISNFIANCGSTSYKLLISVHIGISVWTAVDTILFVLIFYKTLLTDNKV